MFVHSKNGMINKQKSIHMGKTKILIIEGPDNCGKDTLIRTIALTKKVIVKHCSKPAGCDSPEESLRLQKESFLDLADTIIDLYKENDYDYIIMNRFHYGEMIYGQMYRNENPDDIREMIREVDKRLTSNVRREDIGLVVLTATDPSFLSRNEDGLSLSNGKQDLIKKEIDTFWDVFHMSLIPNKALIYADDGKGNWNDPVTICQKVTRLFN